jgi:hypothetical protein
MKSLSPQLNQRVEEGSVIGKPEHDWQLPPGNGNIWWCSGCPCCIAYNGDNLLAEPHYEIPPVPDSPWASYLNGHDRACPCLCVVCTGEHRRITERHLLKRTSETSYFDFMNAVADVRRKQIEEK